MKDSQIISVPLFQKRKEDHITQALREENQAGLADFDRIHLSHEALPELDFKDLDIKAELFGRLLNPFFVSSMTAGHNQSFEINRALAAACETRHWAMGVGSQRRELFDDEASNEWNKIRKLSKNVCLMGNIGLSQLISSSGDQIKKLAGDLEAAAMIIHTNPLQECIQTEGTPQFSGGLKALEKICKELSIPVILKETGCGFSKSTLEKLRETGLFAVDVSGLGGTHWGRIEGQRSNSEVKIAASRTFKDWGVGTVDSVLNALAVNPNFEIWASGGVRSGLDGAKLLSLGAKRIGIAQPLLKAVLESEDKLNLAMETLEFELKVAMFCTGSQKPSDLLGKCDVKSKN